MSDDAFDGRLDQLDRVLKVINTNVPDNHELQVKAFESMMGGAAPAPASPTLPPASGGDGNGGGRARRKAATTPKTSGTKRSGKTVSIPKDKTLNIAPTGKQSWLDFVADKQPANQNEKNTVAVYWLLEVAELPKATISQVVTLFLAAKWDLPPNPKNSAQVAGSAGYLDTADADDIKVTSPGTALVVNDLPHPPKKK